MSQLQIPRQYQPGIKKVLDLQDSVFESVIGALKEAVPTLHVENLASQVASKVKGIHADEVTALLESIMALYLFKDANDMETEQIIEDIADVIDESPDFDDISEDNKKLSVERLSKLLSLEGAIKITSKAMTLLYSYQYLFMGARIFTDIRPIFDSGIDRSPTSALVVHTLKIEYQENNEKKEFFLALDEFDIQQLQSQLDRAERKTESLKAMLKKAEITYLDTAE